MFAPASTITWGRDSQRRIVLGVEQNLLTERHVGRSQAKVDGMSDPGYLDSNLNLFSEQPCLRTQKHPKRTKEGVVHPRTREQAHSCGLN